MGHLAGLHRPLDGVVLDQRIVGAQVDLGCGMAMSHVPAGESPAQITASHGSGIEPCRFTGDGELDA